MKIAVYAISKNESKFAERWAKSMSEADGVFVLDTGSSDDTVEILRRCGVTVAVRDYAGAFRFDVARNDAMDMVPDGYDVLVSTDLDETFPPGWRAELERSWTKGCVKAEIDYVWSWKPDGTPDKQFKYHKIHAPGACRWTHPVHEVLKYSVQGKMARPKIRLEHHPDREKSREQYLGLLEMSVAECPEDDRNQHYLGREYMYRGRWEDAIRVLREHVSNPNATWPAEKAQSMRFIGRCYAKLGENDLAELWYRRAIDECRTRREPAVEFARFAYRNRLGWGVVESACRAALAVTRPDGSYLVESDSWGYPPHDMLALALWYTGRRKEALVEAAIALDREPGNKRLADNVRMMGVALGRTGVV